MRLDPGGGWRCGESLVKKTMGFQQIWVELRVFVPFFASNCLNGVNLKFLRFYIFFNASRILSVLCS